MAGRWSRFAAGFRSLPIWQRRILSANSSSMHTGATQSRLYPGLAAASGVVLGGLLIVARNRPNGGTATVQAETQSEFSLQEVAAHNSMDSGVWVTHGNSVYDVTDFIGSHPGGERIMLAAGGDIRRFWDFYGLHKTAEVRALLEEYRIGILDAASRAVRETKVTKDEHDPYTTDPDRSPLLQELSSSPYNAEPPEALLVEEFITPKELFYVRNHLPVPVVDPKTYVLEVVVPGRKSLHLSLSDMKEKFPKHTIAATLQCAGNRLPQMSAHKPVKGASWGSNIISNAEWSGAKLSDVLRHAGYNEAEHAQLEHVQFEGLDKEIDGTSYGLSIPMRTAMDRYGDVLLAYEMNGDELPRDHGYPVRALVPGSVGSRNVKWLGRVVASHEESQTTYQKEYYKSFSPGDDWDSVDFEKVPPIYDTPVQSAMCIPANGSKIDADEESLSVKGYAWSGGGRGVIRVDVSIDGGKSWQVANLLPPDDARHVQKSRQKWAWTLWEIEVAVPEKMRQRGHELEVVCKAVDESYNNQPDTVGPIWNLKCLLNNAWDRRKVTVV